MPALKKSINNMGDSSSLSSSSPYSTALATTRYGKEAIRLIRSATRSLTYVIYVTAALVVFSLLDLFGVLYHLRLYSEAQHDYIVSVMALVLLGVLFPLAWRVLKARMALNSWQDVFERGSLRMGISMALARRDKGEALNAVAEAVEELEPLRRHLASASTSRFTDASAAVAGEGSGQVAFDALVDESMVETEELKRLMREYGAIVLALVDVADASGVAEFRRRLKTYSGSTGRRVGMAVMVAREVTDDARQSAAEGEILLVEKAGDG